MTDYRDLAAQNEVLRGMVGSTAHGTAIDGQDDRDEMAVYIEPIDFVLGITSYRRDDFDSFEVRTQPQNVRSGPGDLDLSVHTLRRFCHLCYRGNPSMLMLMWLPEYIVLTDTGKRLLEIREAFFSRETGWRYVGYLKSQREALTGERGAKVRRPDLMSKYGYDTKYAMHALRLGYQGLEVMGEGKLTIPVPEPQRNVLRSIRRGELSLEGVLKLITDTENQLRELTERSSKQADADRINKFLVSEYQLYWKKSESQSAPSTTNESMQVREPSSGNESNPLESTKAV